MKLSLKAAGINSGLTQKCVAKRLNVNVSTISNWEQGKTYPTANKLAQLCSIYHVGIDDIFLLKQ